MSIQADIKPSMIAIAMFYLVCDDQDEYHPWTIIDAHLHDEWNGITSRAKFRLARFMNSTY